MNILRRRRPPSTPVMLLVEPAQCIALFKRIAPPRPKSRPLLMGVLSHRESLRPDNLTNAPAIRHAD